MPFFKGLSSMNNKIISRIFLILFFCFSHYSYSNNVIQKNHNRRIMFGLLGSVVGIYAIKKIIDFHDDCDGDTAFLGFICSLIAGPILGVGLASITEPTHD